MYNYPILIIASASADASAAKYSEMSAILGVLGHIWPPYPSLGHPPGKKKSTQNKQSGSITQFVSTLEIEKLTTTVNIAYRWQR